MNWITSEAEAEATTFAFSSVFILLLWGKLCSKDMSVLIFMFFYDVPLNWHELKMASKEGKLISSQCGCLFSLLLYIGTPPCCERLPLSSVAGLCINQPDFTTGKIICFQIEELPITHTSETFKRPSEARGFWTWYCVPSNVISTDFETVYETVSQLANRH